MSSEPWIQVCSKSHSFQVLNSVKKCLQISLFVVLRKECFLFLHYTAHTHSHTHTRLMPFLPLFLHISLTLAWSCCLGKSTLPTGFGKQCQVRPTPCAQKESLLTHCVRSFCSEVKCGGLPASSRGQAGKSVLQHWDLREIPAPRCTTIIICKVRSYRYHIEWGSE